jgi:hypothetical protein
MVELYLLCLPLPFFTITFTALALNSAPHLSSVNHILVLQAKFGSLACHIGLPYHTPFDNLRRLNMYVGFEVFTAVVIKSIIFWDMTPCSPLSFN